MTPHGSNSSNSSHGSNGTIGIIGAGHAGDTLARALIAAGYDVLLANSRGPGTLAAQVRALGPTARAVERDEAAADADLVVLAFPYAPGHVLPAEGMAGKVVLDNNNYMPWRDGRFPDIDAGALTVHELRSRQLPGALLAKAFSHIQFHGRQPARRPGDEIPALLRLARPAGSPDRMALSVSSDHPEAIEAVTVLYDRLGFDTVDAGPLRESWRTAPGTPVWQHSVDGQTSEQLRRRLAQAIA